MAISSPKFNALGCLDQILWKGWNPHCQNEIKRPVLIGKNGFFANLKDWEQNAPPKLGYFKSDDDETWQEFTTGRNLHKLIKLLITSSSC